ASATRDSTGTLAPARPALLTRSRALVALGIRGPSHRSGSLQQVEKHLELRYFRGGCLVEDDIEEALLAAPVDGVHALGDFHEHARVDVEEPFVLHIQRRSPEPLEVCEDVSGTQELLVHREIRL